MQKFIRNAIVLLLLPVLFLAGGCSKVTPAELPEHTVMETSVVIPDDTSNLLRAYLLAADLAANQVIDKKLEQKPQYISFHFTTNAALSQEERDKMMELFEAYGVTVDDRGLNSPKRTLEERAQGITIGFPSTTKYQTSDCDLTIPIDVYLGSRCYTYTADYMIEKGEYILFRWEMLYDQKFEW